MKKKIKKKIKAKNHSEEEETSTWALSWMLWVSFKGKPFSAVFHRPVKSEEGVRPKVECDAKTYDSGHKCLLLPGRFKNSVKKGANKKKSDQKKSRRKRSLTRRRRRSGQKERWWFMQTLIEIVESVCPNSIVGLTFNVESVASIESHAKSISAGFCLFIFSGPRVLAQVSRSNKFVDFVELNLMRTLN